MLLRQDTSNIANYQWPQTQYNMTAEELMDELGTCVREKVDCLFGCLCIVCGQQPVSELCQI